jgi:proline-specific peptidase
MMMRELSETSKEWKGWTCDELTPDLCELHEESGEVKVKGNLTVKYWKFEAANVTMASRDGFPIIMLHGGPGYPHSYMLPLKQQACRGRPVYFYDQMGCGESRLPTDSSMEDYPWLLDPKYYALDELPRMIEFWEMEKFHLVGHSWGSLLAQMFALDAQHDDRLISMTLSGTYSDAQTYINAQWDQDDGTLGSLPPFVQARIHELLKQKNGYDTQEYHAINNVLTTFFGHRTSPAPDCVEQANSGGNYDIYVGMQGPSEFAISGSLEHFNTTQRLMELRNLPVLLTSGKFDTMRPAAVQEVYEALPLAEWFFLNKSGHDTMIDQPGELNDAIANFLERVEDDSGVAFAPIIQPTNPIMLVDSHPVLRTWEVTCIVTVSVLVGWFLGFYTAARQMRYKYSRIE